MKLVFELPSPEAQPTQLDLWSDADWAQDFETRRSTSGGLVMLLGNVISGWARTQLPLALSSGESEFYSGTAAVHEGFFVRSKKKVNRFFISLAMLKRRQQSPSISVVQLQSDRLGIGGAGGISDLCNDVIGGAGGGRLDCRSCRKKSFASLTGYPARTYL